MSNSGKHRKPDLPRHRKDSRSRVVARGGLLGAAIVGCGLLAQYAPETFSESASADVSDANGLALPDPVTSRNFSRPPLVSTAGPAASAGVSAVPTISAAAPVRVATAR